MSDNALSKEWKFKEGRDEMARIGGDWGFMYFDYEKWDIKSYKCKICGYLAGKWSSTRNHISQDHGVQEKLECLAEELDIQADSRIDRFSEVYRTMGKENWADKMIEKVKRSPPVESDGDGNSVIEFSSEPKLTAEEKAPDYYWVDD